MATSALAGASASEGGPNSAPRGPGQKELGEARLQAHSSGYALLSIFILALLLPLPKLLPSSAFYPFSDPSVGGGSARPS